MSLLLALAVRLLPIGAILLLRRGAVSPSLLVIAIVVTIVMVVVNLYTDYLRGAYSASEHNATVANPIRSQLNRFAQYRVITWVAYGITLILLLVVQ